MNKVSISFATAKFIFVSYLALALLTTFVVVSQAAKSVNEQQQAFVKLETDTLSKSLRQFLTNRQLILQEQSQHPLIVQSMMQSTVNRLKIAEYFQHLRFLGDKYQHSLLDFEGQFIYATNDLEGFYHHDAPWLQPLIVGDIPSHISVKKIGENYYWVLAQAIVYQNEIEGVITATIAFEDILKKIGAPAGLTIKFMQSSTLIAQLGDINQGITRDIDWPIEGLSLQFIYDDTLINQAMSELIIQLTVLIIIAILIISCLAYYFGRRYLVDPVEKLALATTSLEDGKELSELTSDIKIKELSRLTKSFNRMSRTIYQREQALLTSQKELLQSHKDLKESESQRIQNEKMASLGILVAGVAHEINNPIGFVKSNIDTLQGYWSDILALIDELKSTMTDETLQQQFDELFERHDAQFIIDDINPLIDSTNDGIARVTEIVKGLKTFARNDSPEMVLSDINEGLRATLVMAQNELKYHCEIKTQLGDVPPTLMFPSKINQVLMNLLHNAGQAIKDKGIITIVSDVKDNEIFVQITDTGEGIAPDKLSEIFNPFYTSKPVGQGTGLGLAISHSIMEQHGGRIEVESTVGEGSSFTIYLPISEQS